ncbi:MAG: hypothetical protein JWO57_4431 [Pseudonocardiales bacterium]|jgi:hypothetical protein|nr:hypothetical protein [Pseudonocardiales bacterium]
MGLPYEHVNYDFGAADRLSWALSMAHEKIGSFAKLRASHRSSLLGDPHSDNWQGARRARFEGEFAPEQHALHALAEEMLRIKAAVDHATEQAHAVNAHAH